MIRYLVQHRMVDCLVTTAGGIEEDLIKCLRPTFVGDFALDGKARVLMPREARAACMAPGQVERGGSTGARRE